MLQSQQLENARIRVCPLQLKFCHFLQMHCHTVFNYMFRNNSFLRTSFLLEEDFVVPQFSFAASSKEKIFLPQSIFLPREKINIATNYTSSCQNPWKTECLGQFPFTSWLYVQTQSFLLLAINLLRHTDSFQVYLFSCLFSHPSAMFYHMELLHYRKPNAYNNIQLCA